MSFLYYLSISSQGHIHRSDHQIRPRELQSFDLSWWSGPFQIHFAHNSLPHFDSCVPSPIMLSQRHRQILPRASPRHFLFHRQCRSEANQRLSADQHFQRQEQPSTKRGLGVAYIPPYSRSMRRARPYLNALGCQEWWCEMVVFSVPEHLDVLGRDQIQNHGSALWNRIPQVLILFRNHKSCYWQRKRHFRQYRQPERTPFQMLDPLLHILLPFED